MRLWMDHYVRVVAANQNMTEALRAIDSDAPDHAPTRSSILDALTAMLKAGVEEASIRPDARADDVLASVAGIFLASNSSEQTHRLLDLLIDGLAALKPDRRAATGSHHR